jgi:hypothetical protein
MRAGEDSAPHLHHADTASSPPADRPTAILQVTHGRGMMFLMWIAGVWLGTNIAVVAVLVALAERGQRREAAIPPARTAG